MLFNVLTLVAGLSCFAFGTQAPVGFQNSGNTSHISTVVLLLHKCPPVVEEVYRLAQEEGASDLVVTLADAFAGLTAAKGQVDLKDLFHSTFMNLQSPDEISRGEQPGAPSVFSSLVNGMLPASVKPLFEVDTEELATTGGRESRRVSRTSVLTSGESIQARMNGMWMMFHPIWVPRGTRIHNRYKPAGSVVFFQPHQEVSKDGIAVIRPIPMEVQARCRDNQDRKFHLYAIGVREGEHNYAIVQTDTVQNTWFTIDDANVQPYNPTNIEDDYGDKVSLLCYIRDDVRQKYIDEGKWEVPVPEDIAIRLKESEKEEEEAGLQSGKSIEQDDEQEAETDPTTDNSEQAKPSKEQTGKVSKVTSKPDVNKENKGSKSEKVTKATSKPSKHSKIAKPEETIENEGLKSEDKTEDKAKSREISKEENPVVGSTKAQQNTQNSSSEGREKDSASRLITSGLLVVVAIVAAVLII